MRVVLIHSPLVGPATWRWVADDLVRAGHDVMVPDLRAAAMTGDPAGVISAAAAGVTAKGTAIVVGHSGAGSLLPSIAAGTGAQLVFVDAGVPPCSGSVSPAPDFFAQLRALSTDGVLPKWSDWWGENAMEALVPDEHRRQRIVDELPQIPLAFYQSALAVPRGWCEMSAAFMLLSDAYRVDAETARSRGWPVRELMGNHLDIVNEPSTIAAAIIEFLS